MPELNTEQSLPEIGTLKYHGTQKNQTFVPINFNGLSLGSQAKSVGLSDRLLRGFEALTASRTKPSDPAPEPASGSMGVIRYNLPSPIQTYRMERRRRSARLQSYGRPLLIVACLAVAVPVGMHWAGKTSSAPEAQTAVPAAEMPPELNAAMPLADAPAALAAAEPAQEAALLETPEAPSVSAPQERVVTVKSGETLGGIAKRNGVSARELASYNGLKNLHSLRVGQDLKIPLAQPLVESAAPAAVAFKPPAEPLVLAPKPEAPAQPVQQAAASEENAPPKPATKPAEPRSYTIRSGDSLSKIAKAFGIKTSTLASANDLSVDDTLSVGKILKVPQADGVYVKLRSGESLSHLAARYGVTTASIQEANQIADPRSLREGQTLFLPGAEPRDTKRDVRRDRGEFKQASRGLIGDLGRAVGKKFIWPTAGRATSYFGERDGRQHTGVDIPRPKGSPIHAAKSGTVIAAGWNGDYGKTVDISHGNGVVTRYAHCSKITVKVGDTVEKGELIGLVGDTGRATGPHLHYEVRIGGRPVNPTTFHN